MHRRAFLTAGGSVALLACTPAGASADTRVERERLACNSWPFRGYFDTPEMKQYRDPKYPLLTQWEFPEFLADTFGIHNVEFLPQHFPDTETQTIEKVKRGLKKAGSRCCNLMGVELSRGVFTRPADRSAALRDAERWIAVAEALEAPSVTVALTGEGEPDPEVAASNLSAVAAELQRRGKRLLFHNDDIKRESAEILVSLVRKLGADRVGTCPDFGNFATRSASYALAQLKMLAPYAANICHAKDGIAEGGKMYRDDFPASMRVMHDSGFRGVYSLEFEGIGAPVEGVKNLMALTEQYLRY